MFLQGIYGTGLQLAYPSLLKPLEWQVTGPAMQPTHQYPSTTTIQFFYDDRKEADKIEAYLPKVVELLKSSPFYRNSEELVLVQKPKILQAGLTEEQLSYTRGGFYLPKQYSYYFTSTNDVFSPDEIYYSHNNPYHSVVLHELTHQMVSRYYGKWLTGISLETWKNEGYAEYMVATGCYSTKAELLAIITERSLSDRMLQDPFSRTKSWAQYRIDDYMAALVQTRYALDAKKVFPLEFMKSSYKLASAQEIKDWLVTED